MWRGLSKSSGDQHIRKPILFRWTLALFGIFLFFAFPNTSAADTASLLDLWTKIQHEKGIGSDALFDDFIEITVVPRQWVYQKRTPKAKLGWDMETLDRGRSVKKWRTGTTVRVFGHALYKEREFLERQFSVLELLTGLKFVFRDFECSEAKDCIEINFLGSKKDPEFAIYCIDCFDVGKRYPKGIYRFYVSFTNFPAHLAAQGKQAVFDWKYDEQTRTRFTQYDLTKEKILRTYHNVNGFVGLSLENTINHTSCTIPGETIIPQQEVQTLVLECLVRSLGLFQISRLDNGVVGRWSNVRKFTPVRALSDYDRLILQMLYLEEISSGLDEEEVRSALRGVLHGNRKSSLIITP